MTCRSLVFASLCLVAAPAAAATQEVTIVLKGSLQSFTAGEGEVAIPIPAMDQANGTLRVACTAPFDCTKVRMGGDAEKRVVGKGNGTPTERLFEIPAGIASFTGILIHADKAATNRLSFAAAAKQPKDDESGKGTLAQNVTGWLARECRFPASVAMPGASVVMTPFGRVLGQSKRRYHDGEMISVSVLADPRVHHLLDVKPTSDLAQPVVTNIYGADQAPFKNHRLGADSASRALPPCTFTHPEPIGPLASPKGGVQVTVYDGEAVKALGSTEFVVAPLYTGTFTLGGISTGVAAPTYAKAFNGTDTVIVERETGRRLLYTAMYTRFWKKRDLTEEIDLGKDLLQAITPMVGIVLNDVANNALLGVNVELRSNFALVGGWHFSRVTQLDRSTGASVGQAFENLGDVPTERKWKGGGFAGLSIDARAAGALLRSVLGGTGS